MFFPTFANGDADLSGENRKAFRPKRNVGDAVRAARTVEKETETRLDVDLFARLFGKIARIGESFGFARFLRERAVGLDVVVIDDRRALPIELTTRSGEKTLLFNSFSRSEMTLFIDIARKGKTADKRREADDKRNGENVEADVSQEALKTFVSMGSNENVTFSLYQN